MVGYLLKLREPLVVATRNPTLPDFVGEEVTKYYNCNLASNPYMNWDLNDLENTMVVQMRNQQLYLVCIWDREKDTCQEEIVNDVSEQDEYSSKEVKFY